MSSSSVAGTSLLPSLVATLLYLSLVVTAAFVCAEARHR